MRAIKTLDRPTVDRVGAEILEAAAVVAARHGLSVALETGRQSPFDASVTLHVATTDGEGRAVTVERLAFKRHAEANGLSPDDLDATFVSNGRAYAISGWNSRAKAYPVTAVQKANGETYKFPAATVRDALAATRAKAAA